MLKKSFFSVLLTAAAFIFLSPSAALAQRGGHGGGGGHSAGAGHSYSSGRSGGHSVQGGGHAYSGRGYSAPAYRGGYSHGGHYYGYSGGYYGAPYGYYYAPSLSFGYTYGCAPAGFYDAAGYWHPYPGCAAYPPY